MKSLFAHGLVGALAGVVVIIGLMVTPASCTSLVAPPNMPVDVQNAIGCVTAALLGGGGVGSLVGCIAQYGPALIADVLSTLLHSSFATAHPELVPVMNARLVETRATVGK
jgi:hypothetical protein